MLYNCTQHGLNCPHNFNFNNNILALKGASVPTTTTTEDTNKTYKVYYQRSQT